jgi:hypothetical protein
MTLPASVIEYTNLQLAEWHADAKRDYGYVGSGTAKFNAKNNTIEIFYRMGAIECLFESHFHPDSEVDTAWRMWMQCHDIESDADRYTGRIGNH